MTFVVDFGFRFCCHIPNKKEWKYVLQTAKWKMELEGRLRAVKRLKESKPLRYALGALFLVLLCYNLPNLLFFPLCLKEDIFRPPNTEVLVSACKKPDARGVPGGEAVFIYEGLTDKTYLLDLRTGEKRKIPIDPLFWDYGVFLSPDLVWLEGSSTRPGSSGYIPHYLFDLKDGKRYELLDITWLPLRDGKFDSKNYAYFESATNVYVHHTKNRLIALSPDFRANPNSRVIFSGYSMGTENGKGLEALANEMEINFEIVDFSLAYADVPSPTGKYIVRNDGIYFVQTNTLIVGRVMNFHFRGWYYNESGVVFMQNGYFLVSSTLLGSHYPMWGPIFKLNLPAP
ncbi:MAG: hypothetical protein HUU12_14330 [Anaerolineales bacterium]|nr:hypothetical protein [Anaerolineales bacterium]